MRPFVVFVCVFLAVSVQAGWFDDAKDWLGGAAETAGEFASNAKDTIVEKASGAGEWAKNAGEKVGEFAKNVTWDDVVNGAKTAGNKVEETANNVYNKLVTRGERKEVEDEERR